MKNKPVKTCSIIKTCPRCSYPIEGLAVVCPRCREPIQNSCSGNCSKCGG